MDAVTGFSIPRRLMPRLAGLVLAGLCIVAPGAVAHAIVTSSMRRAEQMTRPLQRELEQTIERQQRQLRHQERATSHRAAR